MASSETPSIAWVGFHEEGLPTLQWLLESERAPCCVVTLTPNSAAHRSGAAPVARVAREQGIPVLEVDSVNSPESVAFLTAHAPDLLLVLGWSQILRDEVLAIPRVGTVGAHASLLPKDRGSAPVNWAIIRGYTESGNTLMWLAPGIDTGDIIAQRSFAIDPWDTCASVYGKVAETNRDMVEELLSHLEAGRKPGTPQPPDSGEPLPRRRPSDGVIDWTKPAKETYDFVRALTRPYPGAFTTLDGRRLTVWAAALPPACESAGATPGTVVGVVHSPAPTAAGVCVSCGEGTLHLLEVEVDGRTFTGYELIDVLPTGMVFE